MKRILETQTFLTLCIALVMFLSFAQNVHAKVIDVDFQHSPLFGESNLLPGDTATRTFTVTNTSGEPQNVRIATVEEKNGGLEKALVFMLKNGSSNLYTDTLKHLYNKDYVELGTLANNATKMYSVTIGFPIEAGNAYKGKSTGFDLCVGFAGEGANCVTSTDPDTLACFDGDNCENRGASNTVTETVTPDSQFESVRVVPEGDRELLALSDSDTESSNEEGSVRGAEDARSGDARPGVQTESLGSAVFGLPKTLTGVLKCMFFFIFTILLVTLLTHMSDVIRDTPDLSERRRVLGRIVIFTLLLTASIVVALVARITCIVLPLFVSIALSIFWFIFADFRLRKGKRKHK